MTQAERDKRQMRRLYYFLLPGIALIWMGLSENSQNVQLVGEAICLTGFAWIVWRGWRVMQRCARRTRDGTEN